MSTSTSTAPPSALGECVVCGKESSSCCSKCAKGGVDWMFFCSVDHQKLIWDVHKHVCGGGFKWPAIKAKEKVEMIALSTKRYNDSTGATTWLEVLGRACVDGNVVRPEEVSAGIIPAVFEEMLSAFMGDIGQRLGCQRLLYGCRATAFKIKANSFFEGRQTIAHSGFHKLIASDPVSFLALTQLKHTSWLECFEKLWYSDFQHKTMILVGVVNYFHLAPDVSPATSSDLVSWTANKVREFAQDVIRRVDPKEATEIVEVYLPDLMEVSGTREEAS